MNARRLTLATGVRCMAGMAAAIVSTLACFPTTAAALPEGRVYEQVSPVEKEGYAGSNGIKSFRVALNGEAVAFASPGTFLGAQSDKGYNAYLARRTDSGWSTVPDSLPTTLEYNGSSLEDVSANLEQAVAFVKVAPNEGRNNEAHEVFFALYRPDHTFIQLPAEALKAVTSVPGWEAYIAAGNGRLSADLSHLIFTTRASTLLPEDTTEVDEKLYGIAGVGGADPRLEVIDKDSNGCGVQLGAGGRDTFHAMNTDGSEVFFTACGALYVRVNGSETIQISASAAFRGANAEGSKVFFTEGGSLYEDEIEAGAVTGHVLVAEGVSGVVRISDDGTRVYFVAGGELAGANGEGRSPVAGADNLYVYEPDPEHPGQYKTAFVADLCSGLKVSGAVSGDAQCPGSGSDEALDQEAQTASVDGRFLVFASYGQLTADDHDTAKDIYRYDAREGRLERVSIGENGYDNNGNNNAFDAHIIPPKFSEGKLYQQLEMDTRAVSEDGSKILFTTVEPLSPRVVNGQTNVYEWHAGQVSLISSGTSPEADRYPVITPSGRDIFFDTAAGLVPQDTDGVRDVYDARAGGGFPIQPAPPAGCGGQSCQGAASIAPLFQAPATVTQPAEGGVQSVAKAVKRKPKPKKKAKGKGRKKGKKAKTSLTKGRGAKRAQSATRGGWR